MNKRKISQDSNDNRSSKEMPFSVLIVGTGLTGAICCQRIRSSLAKLNGRHVRIEAIDMARGAGGRMSTTRQTIGNREVKANTGAQYASVCSNDTQRALLEVCGNSPKDPLLLKPVPAPMERSLHFHIQDAAKYTHYEIPGGTNNLVKQFLYAGQPDVVSFETRLNKLWKNPQTNRIIPEFDLRRNGKQKNTKNAKDQLSKEFDVVVVALPPKDAVKFFNSGPNNKNNQRHDPQSQADLHRRYNQNNKQRKEDLQTSSLMPVNLDPKVRAQLRKVEYIGRYSLTLWFDQDAGQKFAQTAFDNWQRRNRNDEQSVLDAVFLQGQVLVAQSTVSLWRNYSGVHAGGGRGGGRQRGKGQSAGTSLNQISGGGRQAVRTALTQALEDLGGRRIPKVAHAKLLNWRTSQVEVPLQPVDNEMLSIENGQVILTGDWCTESSLEGCYRAAGAASQEVLRQLEKHHVVL